MPISAQEVFAEAVRALSPTERLRLDGLTQSNLFIVDNSDLWSEHDQRDLSAFSLRYAATLYPEDEELI